MEIRDQSFGLEVEMTGVTRRRAAQVLAEYFGTAQHYDGGAYNAFSVPDSSGRIWKLVSDASIDCQRKENGRRLSADRSYSVELVTPICTYGDIPVIQELVRGLREAGAFSNDSCGIHIHVNAAPFTADKLRNLVNIMAAKEDMIYRALQVSGGREADYCRKIDRRFLEELNQQKPDTLEALKYIWYGGGDRSYIHYDYSRYRCLNLHSVFQKGTIEFRAFNSTLHAGKIKAYLQFCMAITAQAYNQRSARPVKTQSTNEKYTFRVWLLRLGLIGDEFKTARSHLLSHLEGCIAWKDPTQAVQQRERLRQQRELERQGPEPVPEEHAPSGMTMSM
ncbi:amidoligase family protein [Pseudoflavonifractor phocaeensis]|uniref:amidoligase family protein n=1 Tax=Pseudoflavonifractor phocaeensis TaxID=1870988 RepID=UPI002108BF30|nr:amidoligase family protein [Pseudoflavonifractor phocaeensis]